MEAQPSAAAAPGRTNLLYVGRSDARVTVEGSKSAAELGR